MLAWYCFEWRTSLAHMPITRGCLDQNAEVAMNKSQIKVAIGTNRAIQRRSMRRRRCWCAMSPLRGEWQPLVSKLYIEWNHDLLSLNWHILYLFPEIHGVLDVKIESTIRWWSLCIIIGFAGFHTLGKINLIISSSLVFVKIELATFLDCRIAPDGVEMFLCNHVS